MKTTTDDQSLRLSTPHNTGIAAMLLFLCSSILGLSAVAGVTDEQIVGDQASVGDVLHPRVARHFHTPIQFDQ